MGGCRDRSARRCLGRGGEKGRLKEALAAEIVAKIDSLVGAPVEQWDFEAIEVAARREALRIACLAVARRFNADHSDHSGPALPCPCGAPARYAGRRPKTFTTALGDLKLERAYFHCDRCEAGFCPRDRALGLEGGSFSPHALRMIGIVGARVSFEEGHGLLHDLAGVDVPTKQVEREAERLGREIAEDERRVVEPDTEEPLPPTLSLGMDGTGIPMHKRALEGRAGKQEDGSSKTREVKLVTVWSAEGRDKEGVPVRDDGSITYSAAIESAASRDTDEEPSELARRVVREAARRRFAEAPRRVVLGDGAEWIWNIAGEQFPDAVQIVDRFHANEHLSAAAKAIYGPEGDLHKEWTHQRCTERKAGKVGDVLAALAVHSCCEGARACSEYIRRNRDRMRYGELHATGLCTSTAVVESGCKRAIGLRLKEGGMFWSVAGANAIIALRCCLLSRRFEDFWERRAAA
ncbi:MAG: ISKra4 family transposase [Deltaproteobacteria bacterium]|nr:ISKra4 family transposase [Deltaproteobacteria bacterium]